MRWTGIRGKDVLPMNLIDLPSELLKVEEAARFLRIGRTKVYELMARGDLPGSGSGVPCASLVAAFSIGSRLRRRVVTTWGEAREQARSRRGIDLQAIGWPLGSSGFS